MFANQGSHLCEVPAVWLLWEHADKHEGSLRPPEGLKPVLFWVAHLDQASLQVLQCCPEKLTGGPFLA